MLKVKCYAISATVLSSNKGPVLWQTLIFWRNLPSLDTDLLYHAQAIGGYARVEDDNPLFERTQFFENYVPDSNTYP